MEIVSRDEAKHSGLKWYFTGVPCCHGHVAKRSLSNRECRGCVDAKQKSQRAAGTGRWKSVDARRYRKDPAKSKAMSKAQRLKHLEKRREYDRLRYINNPQRKAATIARAAARYRRIKEANLAQQS